MDRKKKKGDETGVPGNSNCSSLVVLAVGREKKRERRSKDRNRQKI